MLSQADPGTGQGSGRGTEICGLGRVEILPQRHPEPPSNHCGYHCNAISFPPAEKRPGPSATARAQLSLACSPFQHPALCLMVEISPCIPQSRLTPIRPVAPKAFALRPPLCWVCETSHRILLTPLICLQNTLQPPTTLTSIQTVHAKRVSRLT